MREMITTSEISHCGKKSKVLYFEVMRVLAIIFVIFNHTNSDGSFLFKNYPATSLAYWAFLFLSIFCKFAVPMFFAISGALVLHKTDESYIHLWLNKILKYGIILVVFSAVYAASNHFLNGNNYSLYYFIGLTWSSYDLSVHLWYLYSYIAFLIGLPLLKVLAQNLTDSHFKYWALIIFAFNLIAVLEFAVWKDNFSLNDGIKPSWMLATIVTCPMIGYYLEHRLKDEITSKKLIVIWAVNIACIILCAVFTTYRARRTGVLSEGESQPFFDNFAFVNTITLYLTVKAAVRKIRFSDFAQKIILSLGECSFGVYLLHILVMQIPFSVNLKSVILSSGIGSMLGIWIYVLYVFLVSYIITLILRKIPLIKKLVGG